LGRRRLSLIFLDLVSTMRRKLFSPGPFPLSPQRFFPAPEGFVRADNARSRYREQVARLCLPLAKPAPAYLLPGRFARDSNRRLRDSRPISMRAGSSLPQPFYLVVRMQSLRAGRNYKEGQGQILLPGGTPLSPARIRAFSCKLHQDKSERTAVLARPGRQPSIP